MLLPPEMIMSFERSRSVRKPSSSRLPRSPVCSQPPRRVSALAAGFCQSLHDAIALGNDLADFAGRQFPVILVDDLDQHTGARHAAGAQPLMPARVAAVRMHALRQPGNR